MNATDPAHSLNEAQRLAVLHNEGPLLVLAGPGSGKTRVITLRLARLLAEGVPARQMLALTFTNKAAEEMSHRLRRLTPDAEQLWIGTFHRFAARMLRSYASLVGLEPNFSICDSDDSRMLMRLAVASSGVELTHVSPADIAKDISWAKARMVGPEQYQPSFHSSTGYLTAEVYPHYQQQLLQANAVDFDDLLYYLATLLRDNPELRRQLDARFRYVLVDEYQDTNHAQYAIARALSIDYPNLMVTGDPDQSIYSWRGANIENILEFERDFPEASTIRLEANYRSTPQILAVADALIQNNLRRKHKTLQPTRGAGPPVRLHVLPSDTDEARQVAASIAEELTGQRRKAGDFAVFYRTNSQSRLFELALAELGVPYHIVHGVEFFQRKEIRDVLAYLQLVNNPRNDIALRRVINTPPRRIGKVALQRLEAYAVEHRCSLLEACRNARGVDKLASPAAKAASGFSQLIDDLSVQSHGLVKNVLELLLAETQFQEYVRQLPDGGEDRAANVDELLNDAAEFDARHPEDGGLERYLEERALVNESDDLDSSGGSVAMMTLHAAKGLEFPVVFVVGVEQGLLPHQRSLNDDAAMEEERRLLFVGITRAQEVLQISMAHYRNWRGSRNATVPSSFLLELPREQMQVVGLQPYSWGGVAESPSADDYCQDAASDAWDTSWSDPNKDHDETDYQQLGPTVDEPIGGAVEPTVGAQSLPGLRTAAELLQQAARGHGPREAPNLFVPGATVQHPQYGTGQILAVSGRDQRRVAQVRFVGEAGDKKMILHYSPLTAVPGNAADES